MGERHASKIALAGFLALALVFTALAGPGDESKEPATKSGMRYRLLGNTGLKVSEIGFGGGALADPALARYALDQGINYFDTAAGYGNGASEKALGEVAAKSRDRMVICTKLGLTGKSTQEEVIQAYEESLKRLQTTYCDILMIHGGNEDAVNNKAIYEAFERLKKEKKLGFTGISHHGPNLTKELMPVVEQRKVDVLLLSYDPTEYPDLPVLLKKAKEKGMGIVAMKVFGSAKKVKLPEFESKQIPFHLAALRWVLKDPLVDCAIPSLNVMDQIDEYVKASGGGAK